MQQSLFDDHNLLIIGYQKDLRHFRLASAYEKLVELQEKMTGRKDMSGKATALKTLRSEVQKIDTRNLRELANLTLALPDNGELALLKDDLGDIEEGFMREIAGKLGPDDIDYIVPGLHPAHVFLRIGDFERTILAVDLHCRNIGEKTSLRQLQGYAHFKKGVKSMARRSMSLALFEDPLLCVEELLAPEDIQKKLETLQQKLQNNDDAWLELPFALWKARMIPVVTDTPCAEAHLKELLERDRPLQEMDRNGKAKRFLRLMYLAEISRLTTNDLFQVAFRRQQMKEADPGKFEMYMQAL